MATEKSPTVTELIQCLNTLRSDYRKLDKKYNARLYAILGRAAASIEALKKAPKVSKKVLKHIGERKNRDLALTVVTFLTGAKTEYGRQRASKFTRALTYLTDVKQVAADDIAKAIKDAGGIEKLARTAAKETPRTKRANAAKSKLDEESDDEAALKVRKSSGERRFAPNRLKLMVSSALTEKLSKVPLGRKVKMIGRIDDLNHGIGLKITKVTLIEKAADGN
jgi:hypothetical protein